MKKCLSIMVSALLLTGCEKTISYDLPQDAPRLSLDARITAGEKLRVGVGRSVASLDAENPSLLAGASVRVYEEGQLVDSLTYSQTSRIYWGQYVPQPNRQYRVEVSHSELPDARGEDRTPPVVPIQSIEYDSTEFQVTLSFKDPPGPGNKYMLEVYVAIDSINQNQVFLTTRDPLVEFFFGFDDFLGTGEKSGELAFMTDEGFDGKVRQVKFFTGGIENPGVNPVLRLTHLSDEHYRYLKSLGNYERTGNNPFAEPVQVYSNVQDGYGLVGGAAFAEKELR